MFLQGTSEIIIDAVQYLGSVVISTQKFERWPYEQVSSRHVKRRKYQRFELKDQRLQSVMDALQKRQSLQQIKNQIQPYLHIFQFKQAVIKAIRCHKMTLHNALAMTYLECLDQVIITSQYRSISLKIIVANVCSLIQDICCLERAQTYCLMELNCAIFYLFTLIDKAYYGQKLQTAMTMINIFGQQTYFEQVCLQQTRLTVNVPLKQMKNFLSSYKKIQTIEQQVHSLPLLLKISKLTFLSSFLQLNFALKLPFSIFQTMKSFIEITLQFLDNQNNQNNNSQLFLKIYNKAIGMFETQGFVSPKNIFKFGCEIFLISKLLQLVAYLSNYKQKHSHYDWIIQVLQTFDHYEYDISESDTRHLAQIIWSQKLYMIQMNEKKFISQFIEDIIGAHTVFKRDKQYTLNQSLVNCVFRKRINQEYPIVQFNHSEQVLLILLKQIFALRLQYLIIIQVILQRSHRFCSRQQTIKLQFYLLKNQLVHFLLQDCKGGQSLQSYYSCISLMTKRNPIIRAVAYFLLGENRKSLLNIAKSIKNSIKPAREMLIDFFIQEKQLDSSYYHQNQQKYPNLILYILFSDKAAIWICYFCNNILGDTKINCENDFHYLKKQYQLDQESYSLWVILMLLLFQKYNQTEDCISQILNLNLSISVKGILEIWQTYQENSLKTQIIKRNLSYPGLKNIKQQIIREIQKKQKLHLRFKQLSMALQKIGN